MRLTHASRTSPNDDSFPTLQLFLLAICRVAEPIALTSIFPYSWRMVKSFHVGSPHDASFYAGILISAFAMTESLTGMWWGGLSDRIGRKPVLLLGCLGTMLSLLVVGLSQSFTVALIGRLLGGLLNGNIGVIQTMVGELVKKPEHEPKAYSVMPFVWSIGTIVGPAIGGTFANPTENFPSLFAQGGFLDRFPWLLPNLICASFMCASTIAGYFLLEETHPDFRKDADPFVQHEIVEQTPMITAAGVTADPGVDLRQESYGTFNEVEFVREELWDAIDDEKEGLIPVSEKANTTNWFTWKVAMLVICLGIYSCHAMCFEHLLPIFLQEDRQNGITASSKFGFVHIPGGLGMSTKTVGMIMAVNGVIALFIQAVIFPFVADRLGVWRTFALVTILHPIAYFIIPYIAVLPENMVYPGVYICLTLRNVFNILEYPVILILLKQACPSALFLGRLNGLAASVGAASRMIAPPAAGLLYGIGLDIEFTGLAWWGAGILALVGVAQFYLIPRERDGHTTIRSAAPCLAAAMTADDSRKDVVSVRVVEAVEEA